MQTLRWNPIRRLTIVATTIVAALAIVGVAQAATSHAPRGRGASGVKAWTGSGAPPSAQLPTHATAGCLDAYLLPSSANLARVRAAVLCLINQQRHAVGEHPLAASGRLEWAAQAHAADMARGYLGRLGQRDATLRGRPSPGYRIPVSSVRVENVAWGDGSRAAPATIVAGWMNSPQHRAIILGRRFRATGIGVTAGAPEASLDGLPSATYTQVFGVTR